MAEDSPALESTPPEQAMAERSKSVSFRETTPDPNTSNNNDNHNDNNHVDDDDIIVDDSAAVTPHSKPVVSHVLMDSDGHIFLEPDRPGFRERQASRPTLANFSYTDSLRFVKEEAMENCFPTGFGSHVVALCISILALTFTAIGSWDCHYFRGASISFTGGDYGLWTLQDYSNKCQLWDVLFFSFKLGAPLVAARVFSMTSMLLGLGMVTTMAQACQIHLFSWGLGIAFLILFLVSVSTTSIFNVWIVFWWFTYIIMTMITRFLFVHPVHRRISKRGSKIIAGVCSFIAVFNLQTLIVLQSDYCTCAGITSEALSGRDPGEPCEGSCSLEASGIIMIVGGALWIAASIAVLKFGIQPKLLKKNLRRPSHQYAHYPQQSMVSRMNAGINRVTGGLSKASQSGSPSSSLKTTPSMALGDKSSNTNMGAISENIIKEDEPVGEFDCNQQQMPGGHNEQDNDVDESEEVNEKVLTNISDDEDSDEEQSPQVSRRKSWSHLEDKRSCCQRWCCDYRVTPRTRKEKCWFWSFRMVIGFMFFIYGLFIVLMIGSRIENTNAAKKPDTSGAFTTEVVCAFDPNSPWDDFQTLDNKFEAEMKGLLVAHCGACGVCSNPHDIVRYISTRRTIAKRSKSCGRNVFLGFLIGGLADCLEDEIGFTEPCTGCWRDNMVSTGTNCLMTCMRTMFSGFMTNNNVPGAGEDGWMNQCFFCDEQISGPEFVRCSGVARRRLGVVSEIQRNPELQCRNMDLDWVNVNWEEIGFDKWPDGRIVPTKD